MADFVLEIRGMTCGHCVQAATDALQAVAGVDSAEVTLDPPRALVNGSGAQLTDLLQAVAGAGFTPVVSS